MICEGEFWFFVAYLNIYMSKVGCAEYLKITILKNLYLCISIIESTSSNVQAKLNNWLIRYHINTIFY